ncbi:hypothetical protein AAG906_018776 [Vitis piasezkii]
MMSRVQISEYSRHGLQQSSFGDRTHGPKLVSPDSRLEEPLQEFLPLRIKDIPAINTCELEAFYQLVAAMVNESPFHKYSPTSTTLSIQDHSSIAWLDTQAPNSVVYVSFGSIAGLDETDFIEMAWGLANSKQPFLWVVRPGFIRGSEWLEPLPSGFLETIGGRGHIVKWAPQHEVLAHPAVGAFCTHSGWNSTVGVQLENGLKRGEIEGAIRRLMGEKSGQEIRDRCIALKEKANLCLKQAKHHGELKRNPSTEEGFPTGTVSTAPTRSPNPMLLLANILHAKGFSITIIHTHFNSPNPANYPSSPSIQSPTLLSNPSEEPIACLITDAVWHFTQAVANSLKLPRMVLRTSSVSSFLAVAAMPYLQKSGYLPIKDSQLESSVPELLPLKVKDLPVINTRNPEDFYQLFVSAIKETKASSGLIWNSFEDLEESALVRLHQDFPIPLFPVGPFQKYFPTSSSSLLAHDQSSITWLDTQTPKSVIYVSFGSIATTDENEFLEMAWGLANSNQPFLWVVRPGLIRSYEWLESLPNGFLEMIEVLAHPATGGFWTHNGWNSTLESICEGVPMICLPYSGDQRVNARYVSQVWGVGLQLENGLERGEIERTIRRLMVEEEGQEIRRRSIELKEKADLCLKQGGSSHQSLESLISYLSSFKGLLHN